MRWLVTGGAGFIGTNTVLALHSKGEDVTVVDDLSRPGVVENAEVISSQTSIAIHKIDITNRIEFNDFLQNTENFDIILNLAGQVSLMESIRNPMRDFEVNAIGPLQILEFVRKFSPSTLVINMSSNKIYGSLDYLDITELETRYSVTENFQGISESTKLDFHGPYGCSKGSADQYMNDYRRIYGLKTVSLRQSAVYGPFQKPMSDQGWLSFMIQEATEGRIISLNGIGKQVRDLLHVNDLIDLFIEFSRVSEKLENTCFNVGGGPRNQLSILELFSYLKQECGLEAAFKTGKMRPGDQKYFVSDNSLVQEVTGWKPKIDINDGIKSMVNSFLN